MKKVSLLLGAVVLGFVLVSCGPNKKDTYINTFNAFFDEEITYLNQVEDADSYLTYYDAASDRFDQFFDKLNNEIPLDDNDNIVGLSQEDSDAVMKVYNDRIDDYLAKRDALGSTLYEPYIADLETSFDDIVNLLDQYDDPDDIPDEVFEPYYDNFLEKYELADQYVLLSDDDQYDRYYFMYDMLYGDEDED